VLAVIQTESQFNAYAKGTAGEIGLMQIKPSTAQWIAKKYNLPWGGASTLYDPIVNIKMGITYFAHLRSEFESRAHHYIPAYNMGPKNLRRTARELANVRDDHELLNRDYAGRVMKNYNIIYQQLVATREDLKRMARDSEEFQTPQRLYR